MFREMLNSKLHGVTVTETNLEYTGSITIDRNLIKAVGFVVNEKVMVLNLNNGERFSTYVIEGKAGSGVICLNGAAARLAVPGDRLIVLSFALCSDEECRKWKPTIVHVDSKNRPLK